MTHCWPNSGGNNLPLKFLKLFYDVMIPHCIYSPFEDFVIMWLCHTTSYYSGLTIFRSHPTLSYSALITPSFLSSLHQVAWCINDIKIHFDNSNHFRLAESISINSSLNRSKIFENYLWCHHATTGNDVLVARSPHLHTCHHVLMITKIHF